MRIKEIQEAIAEKYDTDNMYCPMFDDIYKDIFKLSDEESEKLTVKEFLLKILQKERK
jgi:hypothetical protein